MSMNKLSEHNELQAKELYRDLQASFQVNSSLYSDLFGEYVEYFGNPFFEQKQFIEDLPHLSTTVKRVVEIHVLLAKNIFPFYKNFFTLCKSVLNDNLTEGEFIRKFSEIFFRVDDPNSSKELYDLLHNPINSELVNIVIEDFQDRFIAFDINTTVDARQPQNNTIEIFSEQPFELHSKSKKRSKKTKTVLDVSLGEAWEFISRYSSTITPTIKLSKKFDILTSQNNSIQHYIKAAWHFENQKVGIALRHQKKTLLDVLTEGADSGEKNAIAEWLDENKITIAGLDLSESEMKVVHAIQQLISLNNFSGNAGNEEITSDNNQLGYQGTISKFKLTKSEFLELYGLTRSMTSRGKMEFSGKSAEIALTALHSLSSKLFLFIVRRFIKTEKGKRKYEIKRSVSPVLMLEEVFSDLLEDESIELERDLLEGGHTENTTRRLSHFIITPNPIFYLSHESNFLFKPANIYEQIELVMGNKTSQSAQIFIGTYLWQRAHEFIRDEKKGSRKKSSQWEVRISIEVLAELLRMNKLINQRKWKMIRDRINDCYEAAKSLGYLHDYKIGTDGKTKSLDILYLNANKFLEIIPQKSLGEGDSEKTEVISMVRANRT